MRLLLGLFLVVVPALIAGPSVHAQPNDMQVSDGPIQHCELVAQGQGSQATPASVVPAATVNVRTGGTFVVEYSGFPSAAEEAFQAAVDIWEAHIVSPVPIRIDASWVPLGSNILGSAGPFLIMNFNEAPIPNTWYPAALANALSGADINPATPEIEATFNSNFSDWYFGTDGLPPSNEYDLTTIVLHEIAHGLGFIGAFRVENGLGTVGVAGEPGVPFVYDRFSEDAVGVSLLDASVYPLNSTALASVLTDSVFLGGRSTVATLGVPAPLYAPAPFNEGSSYSHLDEQTFPENDDDALLTPFLVRGEAYSSPGPLVCSVLADIGWTLAPACADLVEKAEPPVSIAGGFELHPAGPNPFLTETAYRLRVETAQSVKIRVFDRVGRVVAEQSRFLTDGEEATVRIPGVGLASGVYLVQVTGETFQETRAIAKLR